MDIAANRKTAFLITLFLRAIMGRGGDAENTIMEVLGDNYTHEKMNAIVADCDEKVAKRIIAVLAGNGAVCAALNNLPGSGDEKLRFIGKRVWGELIEIVN